jgi:hypothetical protein
MVLDQTDRFLPKLVILLNVGGINIAIQVQATLGLITGVTSDTILNQERADVGGKVIRTGILTAKARAGHSEKQE